jgi:hypothetical protein
LPPCADRPISERHNGRGATQYTAHPLLWYTKPPCADRPHRCTSLRL